MPVDEFLVPYGLGDDGRLVPRDAVEKGRSYRCPACETPLIIKAGEIRRRYLAHRANGECAPESVVHRTAKLLVAQVVNDWKAGSGSVPMVERVCDGCRRPWRAPLPDDKISSAAVEVTVKGRWRVDVALSQGDRVVAAVELWHTHRTGQEKADGLGIPWTELLASAVVEDPLVWCAVGGTNPAKCCPDCRKQAEAQREDAEKRGHALTELGKRLNQPVLSGTYQTGSQRCWSCQGETLVYRWEGQPWAKRAPPQPAPRTIQFLFSKSVKYKYWANSCGACGALQGDHFMFDDPRGAFFGAAPAEPQPTHQHQGERSTRRAVDMFLNRVLGGR